MRRHLRIALQTGPRRWSMNEVRLLGTMNDYELGRRLRRPHHEIRRQRKAFGIPRLSLALNSATGSLRK